MTPALMGKPRPAARLREPTGVAAKAARSSRQADMPFSGRCVQLCHVSQRRIPGRPGGGAKMWTGPTSAAPLRAERGGAAHTRRCSPGVSVRIWAAPSMRPLAMRARRPPSCHWRLRGLPACCGGRIGREVIAVWLFPARHHGRPQPTTLHCLPAEGVLRERLHARPPRCMHHTK